MNSNESIRQIETATEYVASITGAALFGSVDFGVKLLKGEGQTAKVAISNALLIISPILASNTLERYTDQSEYIKYAIWLVGLLPLIYKYIDDEATRIKARKFDPKSNSSLTEIVKEGGDDLVRYISLNRDEKAINIAKQNKEFCDRYFWQYLGSYIASIILFYTIKA
jgi:hypothetical protein